MVVIVDTRNLLPPEVRTYMDGRDTQHAGGGAHMREVPTDYGSTRLQSYSFVKAQTLGGFVGIDLGTRHGLRRALCEFRDQL